MERIAAILQKTYAGTPDEMYQANDYLTSESRDNPEYVLCLLQIISNSEFDENLRLAASIQLKIQVKRGATLPLDFNGICTMIVGTPLRVQLQLQSILFLFIQKFVENARTNIPSNDPNEEINILLNTCAQFIQTNAESALVSVLILRCIIKLRQSYEYLSTFMIAIGQFFIPISHLVASNLNEADARLFIHISLHAASKYAQNYQLPAIEMWVDIITQIIHQESYEIHPFLDKDAIKLAFMLYDSLPPHVNAALLMSIATHSIKGSAYQTTALSFMFLRPALQSEEIWPTIENRQFDLVGGLFFRTFILSEQDLIDVDNDLYNFISNTQITACDFRTPRNGAVTAFSAAVAKHPTLAHCAVQIVLCELDYFRESGDIGRAFGALQFGAFAIQKVNKDFAQKTAQMIYASAVQMLPINNFVYTAAFFQFIGVRADAFNDIQILFKCFEQIIIGQHDLVLYFASYAAANLLSNFHKDAVQIQEQLGASIQPLLSNVLRICKDYSTDQSAATIRHFTDFFADSIAPVATDYINELFNIFMQYASEPHTARISITSSQVPISKICQVIKEQRPDVPPGFFTDALLRIEQIALQINSESLEEVLELMASFADNLNEISEPFLNAPNVLLQILQRVDNDPEVIAEQNEPHPSSFIKVIKTLIRKSPEAVTSPQMFQPIVEMCKNFLLKFNSDNSDVENAVPLFQMVFINLKDFQPVIEIAPFFIQALDQISTTFLADVVAAFVTFNPILTLHNERNFESWMNSHSAVFLTGALSVMHKWQQLPAEITQQKEIIDKKIAENLMILQELSMSEEDDIFNYAEILHQFSQISVQ
ncbi:hypothetical protein TRFO_38424 [Tritrichomonas foetus]|uniref:Importin N-terminal domain-containing protein n=1 Tax=Tritrichomonas foetus TaxID=1144522 RepID=A0A1J4J8K8_9EUKA|nr:hypothetical protein TRFO_38424 [Tritrichomonas foetus]|eukprot:OHS95472.1 hypothetical protein TRFO_38424 [Tritrichomonas foetus]